MINITNKKIDLLCRYLMSGSKSNIGFIDVGSGGNLKSPWVFLPSEKITTFNFEPTDGAQGMPLCISNIDGEALDFFVAVDERSSSLHCPSGEFINRYAYDSMLTHKVVRVESITLDTYFAGRYGSIDAIDINVEGHDFHVLQGAHKLLSEAFVKLIKVEFELVKVYDGQGFFADIDTYLRKKDFRLAGIEIDYLRTSDCKDIFHDGEPIWGKALYAPTINRVKEKLISIMVNDRNVAKGQMAALISLYLAAKLPAYAFDVIKIALSIDLIDEHESTNLQNKIRACFGWAKFEEAFARFKKICTSLRNIIV